MIFCEALYLCDAIILRISIHFQNGISFSLPRERSPYLMGIFNFMCE